MRSRRKTQHMRGRRNKGGCNRSRGVTPCGRNEEQKKKGGRNRSRGVTHFGRSERMATSFDTFDTVNMWAAFTEMEGGGRRGGGRASTVVPTVATWRPTVASHCGHSGDTVASHRGIPLWSPTVVSQ